MRALIAIFRWLDLNLERMVMILTFMVLAGIIFVSVIQRFFFGYQAAWSSTIPIYLFLWATWFGCSYNVRFRSHLRFSEVRKKLPYIGQYLTNVLDGILWLIFAAVVLVFAIEQTHFARMNFAIVQGTDDVMQWWFYAGVPVAWGVLCFRVFQNLWADTRTFMRGDAFSVNDQAMTD